MKNTFMSSLVVQTAAENNEFNYTLTEIFKTEKSRRIKVKSKEVIEYPRIV